MNMMYVHVVLLYDYIYRVDVGFTPEPTSAPTTSPPTTAAPTTADPTTAEPTTAAPTTADPTPNPSRSPTLDGCDFDIDSYLEQCYCTDVGSGHAVFGHRSNYMDEYRNNYQGYDRMNKYNPGSNVNYAYFDEIINKINNNNSLQYWSILLNVVVLVVMGCYICYANSGCCGGKQTRSKYQKITVYDSEKNPINA